MGYTREETVVLSDVMLGGADYEEVQWVDSNDNRFYLTTAVPLFEGGDDAKVEDTSKDLPPYGPPYHDSGIIAKQATDNKVIQLKKYAMKGINIVIFRLIMLIKQESPKRSPVTRASLRN